MRFARRSSRLPFARVALLVRSRCPCWFRLPRACSRAFVLFLNHLSQLEKSRSPLSDISSPPEAKGSPGIGTARVTVRSLIHAALSSRAPTTPVPTTLSSHDGHTGTSLPSLGPARGPVWRVSARAPCLMSWHAPPDSETCSRTSEALRACVTSPGEL